jgi:hypothetical protein
MVKVNMSVKQIGIPCTLSALGRNFVFDEWRDTHKKILPYQRSGPCLRGIDGIFNLQKVCLLLG